MLTPVIIIFFGGLIAWAIYRRILCNIGRQKFHPLRSLITIAALSLVSLTLLGLSELLPKLVSGIGIGLLLGAVLGGFGLRLTKFEITEEGRFYTPDTRIGAALILIFVGRVIYRSWAIHFFVSTPNIPPAFKSALTFLTYGLLAGYYIVYHIGLVSHSRNKNSRAKKLCIRNAKLRLSA